MTEQQRMEEGRRMFQIFAARMFEQRVLVAYREKVARERQEKLIEELDEESRKEGQQQEKKAAEARKKKEKKRQQKQIKDEEKARREAEKAAVEAAARAAEEKKLEEQRQKKEEQRRKKEAEKKAQDEERQRKETEKQKRLQDAREQQAAQERKQREHKEREKKKREEAKRIEKEDREAREKEAKEKREREATEKREREEKVKAEKDAKEQTKKQEHAPKPLPIAVPISSSDNLPSKGATSTRPPAQTRSSHASPHLQVATPVVPKAPTPIRPRQPSFQDSHASSPKASQVPSNSSTTSPGLAGFQQSGTGPDLGTPAQVAPQQTQSTLNLSLGNVPHGAIAQPPGFPPMPAIGGNGFSTVGPMMPPITQRAPVPDGSLYGHHPPLSSPPQRPFVQPAGMPFAPGMNGIRPIGPGRGGPIDPSTSQGPQTPNMIGQASGMGQYGMTRDTMPSHSRSHSRQTSGSFDRTSFETSSIPATAQPIARPAPIQRPSSVVPGQQGNKDQTHRSEIDDLSNHLGSSALLDDTDVPLSSTDNRSRRGSVAPGGSYRQGFGASPMFPDPIGSRSLFYAHHISD